MATMTWTADAESMVWAKLHSGARYAPLVEALAAHLEVSPDSVVVPGGGTSFANHLALAGRVRHGDEVLIESPAYSLMAAVARYLGASVTAFPRRPEEG